MDTLQTTIVIVLSVLTLTTVGIGIYIIFVLKEFIQTIRKANMVLEDVHQVTNAVSNPVSTIAGIVNGITDSLKTAKSVTNLFERKK